MDIREVTKRSTTLTKIGQFDEAVEQLKLIIPEMAKIGGFARGAYTKIIPYFQMAGRYQEGVEYTENILIPYIKQDCRKTFNHKCKEMQQAFQCLGISEAYDKLRLCAKREKRPNDESMYEQRRMNAYMKYVELLEKGEYIELENEYKQCLVVFGVDTAKWPKGVLSQFGGLIKNNKII